MNRLALIILVAVTACASPPSVDPPASLVLQGVTIIDVSSGELLPAMDVVIDGELIVAIQPSGQEPAISAARTVDLQGRFLLPGFVDTHAHVTVLRFPPGGDPRGRYSRELSERSLRLLLAHGITTVRNPSAPAVEGVALRDAVAEGRIRGPRILTSGEHLNDVRMTEEEIREEVRRQAALGVNMIKVYGSLRPQQVKAAIDEAHQQGITVVGHLQRTTWTEAVHLGIDAITHGAPWSREYLPSDRQDDYRASLLGRLNWLEWIDMDSEPVNEMIAGLADSRTPVDPTLIAYHTKFFGNDARYRDHPSHSLFPELAADWRGGSTHTENWTLRDYERGQALWPKVEELIRRYHAANVLLSTGSDAPVPWVIPGISLHEEFELLVAAGISEMAVLRMATRNGAEALRLLDEIGTIEVGKRADLVVLTVDPLKDIRHTREIEFVVLGGELLQPSELLSSESGEDDAALDPRA
jgi:imidazolonepropionase-like amidohydrolase